MDHRIRYTERSSETRIISLLAVLVLTILMVAGVPVTTLAYSNGYHINNYNVDITVNEDNTFDVVETIDAYFDEGLEKHGIIRSIPMTNHVVRADGTSSTNHVTITGLTVDGYDFSIDKSTGEYRVKIGNPYLCTSSKF